MSKKAIIPIILILLIIIGVAVWFFFFNGNTISQNENGDERSGNFFGGLFPFGGNRGDGERPADDPVDDPIKNNGNGITPADGIVLRQLTQKSIAAAVALTQEATTTDDIRVRYVERATGNVFEVNPLTLETLRLSNTTIPGIQEGVWKKSGEQIILRYINADNVIKSFAGTVPTSTIPITSDEEERPLTGTFLEDDIPYIITTADGDGIFYLSFAQTGVNAYKADFNGVNRKLLFSSPHSEWIPQWIDDETVALTTKASGIYSGFLYFVDTDSGEFTKIIDDVSGLTTNVSPDKQMILFSESSEGSFQLKSYDRETRNSLKLSLATLPEKCVWSKMRTGVVYCGVPVSIPSSIYPDSWYQGVTSFTDDVWEIDVLRGITKHIFSISINASQNIDIINPFLSDSEDFLFFMNKKDSTLWSLQLQQ